MRARVALFAALTSVISLFLTVGLAELAVRVAVDDGMDYSLEMWKYARWMKRIASDPVVAHEHVPDASARLMGVEVAINRNGLRDREIPIEKPPGTTRIVMLGDSVTLGWGVDFENTTSKVLERELNATRTSSAVEVINTGVGNYNASMAVQYFLNEGHRYLPDFVVLNYFINDAEETPRYTGHFFNEHFQSWVYLAGRIDTLRRKLGASRPWHEYYSELYRDEAPGWSQAQAAVKRLGAWCRQHRVPCLLANLPELRNLREYPFINVNEKLAQLAEEAGLEYLDLLPSVGEQPEESLWVSAADPHANGKACTLFGQALVDYFDPRIPSGEPA